MNGTSSDNGGYLFLALILFAFGVLIYLLPGILASKRKHPQATAIWVLTIALGWTLLGWVAALVWVSTTAQRVVVEARELPEPIRGADASFTDTSKQCPYCAERIKLEAIVCRFCGRDQPSDPALAAVKPASDDELMVYHGIALRSGRYVYGEYQYDKLSDAIAYAELQRAHGLKLPR